jgi:AcrR family transcriptional regulator
MKTMTSEAKASGAPVGLRERARLERYQNIRAAAEQLFNERGYEQTTTKEVAERAGVGEATLFRYVSNKHELLLLVIGERMDMTLQAIEDADKGLALKSSTARDYVERIYAIFRARAQFYATDPENVTSYLHYGFKAGSQLGAQSIAQGDRIITLITSILDSAGEAGHLTAHVDSGVVAQNCNGTYIHEILRTPARGYRPEDLWEKLHERLRVQIEPLFRL